MGWHSSRWLSHGVAFSGAAIVSAVGAAVLFLAPLWGVGIVVLGAGWFVAAVVGYEAPRIPASTITINPGAATTITVDSEGRTHVSVDPFPALPSTPPAVPPPPASLP